MADKTEKGEWIDPMGAKVPGKYVQVVDRKRDELVERLIVKARKLNKQLADFRKEITGQVETFLGLAGKEAGVVVENAGGNYTFTNFSGNRRLLLKTNATLDFDEKLSFAKKKIDACLDRWSENGNQNLRAVVFQAFNIDAKNRVDIKGILGLRQLKITDQEWQEAMKLITDAITVVGRKSYVFFQIRNSRESKWETICLDMAGMGVE